MLSETTNIREQYPGMCGARGGVRGSHPRHWINDEKPDHDVVLLLDACICLPQAQYITAEPNAQTLHTTSSTPTVTRQSLHKRQRTNHQWRDRVSRVYKKATPLQWRRMQLTSLSCRTTRFHPIENKARSIRRRPYSSRKKVDWRKWWDILETPQEYYLTDTKSASRPSQINIPEQRHKLKGRWRETPAAKDGYVKKHAKDKWVEMQPHSAYLAFAFDIKHKGNFLVQTLILNTCRNPERRVS